MEQIYQYLDNVNPLWYILIFGFMYLGAVLIEKKLEK